MTNLFDSKSIYTASILNPSINEIKSQSIYILKIISLISSFSYTLQNVRLSNFLTTSQIVRIAADQTMCKYIDIFSDMRKPNIFRKKIIFEGVDHITDAVQHQLYAELLLRG